MYVSWFVIIVFLILLILSSVFAIYYGCSSCRYREIMRKLEGKHNGNGVDDSGLGDAQGRS